MLDASTPHDKQALLDKAEQFFLEGDHVTCIANIRHMLQDNPDFNEVKLILGRALFEQEEIQEAKGHLIAYQDAFPGHIMANKLLAKIYMQENDYANARTKIDAVLDKSPSDLPAQRLRDRIQYLFQEDDLPDDTVKTVKPEPTSTMAQLYEDQGHVEQAKEIYEALNAEGQHNTHVLDKLSTNQVDIPTSDLSQAEQTIDPVDSVTMTMEIPKPHISAPPADVDYLETLLNQIKERKR